MRMATFVIIALLITTLAMYAYLLVQTTTIVGGGSPALIGATTDASGSGQQRTVPAMTLPRSGVQADFYLPDIGPRPTNDVEIAFLTLLNRQRQAARLRPLQASTVLNLLADIRVHQMISQAYLGHVDPYGYTMYVELLRLYAISYSEAGEIVGRISGSTVSPADGITTAFMNSPEHRADILSADFSLVGVAEEDSPDGTHYFAAIFLN